MEDKNIALLGFVTSAAEYLKKGLDNNIQEEDLNDAMKELEKNVSSSFSGSEEELLAVGKNAFVKMLNKKKKHLLRQNLQNLDPDALNRAVESFSDAAEQFRKIDMETLNDAVAALDSAAGKLKDVDVDSLNALVEALENTASKLQNAVDGITDFFRW